jgi:hypothetical protein
MQMQQDRPVARVKSLDFCVRRVSQLRVAMLGQHSPRFINALLGERRRINPFEEVHCEKAYEFSKVSDDTPFTMLFSESYLMESYVPMLEQNLEKCDCAMLTYDAGLGVAADELSASVKQFSSIITRIKYARDMEPGADGCIRPLTVIMVGVVGNGHPTPRNANTELACTQTRSSFHAYMHSRSDAEDIVDRLVSVHEMLLQSVASVGKPASPASCLKRLSSAQAHPSPLSSASSLSDGSADSPKTVSSSRCDSPSDRYAVQRPASPGSAPASPGRSTPKSSPASAKTSPRGDCLVQ